jgi:hypothetical protein
MLAHRIELGDTDAKIPAGISRVRVADVSQPILPDRFITADSDAIAVARLLAADDGFFFVIEGNGITGTIDYSSLSKPIFQVCLFALIGELEEAMLKMITLDALASWRALPAGRRQKTLDRFNRRQDQHRTVSIVNKTSLPISDENVNNDYKARCLLAETMFIDKSTILRKRHLLPIMANGELQTLFKAAEEVRNGCAHPGSIEGIPLERSEFGRFLPDLNRVLAYIRENVPDEIIWTTFLPEMW